MSSTYHGNAGLYDETFAVWLNIPFQFLRHIGSRAAAPLCCSPRRSRYGHRAAEHAQASLAHQRRPALVAQQRGEQNPAYAPRHSLSSRARSSVSRGGGSRFRSRGTRPPSSSNARRRRSRRAASEASTTASPPPRRQTESTRRSRQAARATCAPHAPHPTRSTTLCTLCAHSRCLLHAEPPSLPRLLAAEARRPRRLAPAAGSRPRAPERSRAGEGAVRDEAGAHAARRAHRRTLSPRRTQAPSQSVRPNPKCSPGVWRGLWGSS